MRERGCGDIQSRVPGDDGSANAERLAPHVGHARRRVNVLAVDLVGPAGEIA